MRAAIQIVIHVENLFSGYVIALILGWAIETITQVIVCFRTDWQHQCDVVCKQITQRLFYS